MAGTPAGGFTGTSVGAIARTPDDRIAGTSAGATAGRRDGGAGIEGRRARLVFGRQDVLPCPEAPRKPEERAGSPSGSLAVALLRRRWVPPEPPTRA